jgi:hypothetical protein
MSGSLPVSSVPTPRPQVSAHHVAGHLSTAALLSLALLDTPPDKAPLLEILKGTIAPGLPRVTWGNRGPGVKHLTSVTQHEPRSVWG